MVRPEGEIVGRWGHGYGIYKAKTLAEVAFSIWPALGRKLQTVGAERSLAMSCTGVKSQDLGRIANWGSGPAGQRIWRRGLQLKRIA